MRYIILILENDEYFSILKSSSKPNVDDIAAYIADNSEHMYAGAIVWKQSEETKENVTHYFSNDYFDWKVIVTTPSLISEL